MFSPTACIFKNNIIVPIAVVPRANALPQLVCQPFVVPKGTWRIIWNLVTIFEPESPQSEYATFPEENPINPAPGSDPHFTNPEPISDTQWAVSITVGDEEALARPIPYLIDFLYSGESFNSRKLIRHDPTIVVSKDPIEPPPPGGGR